MQLGHVTKPARVRRARAVLAFTSAGKDGSRGVSPGTDRSLAEGLACQPKPRERRRLVPLAGFEPARCCHHQILSLARLPVPPQGLSADHRPSFRNCQCHGLVGRHICGATLCDVGQRSGTDRNACTDTHARPQQTRRDGSDRHRADRRGDHPRRLVFPVRAWPQPPARCAWNSATPTILRFRWRSWCSWAPPSAPSAG